MDPAEIKQKMSEAAEQAKAAERRCDNPEAMRLWTRYERLEGLLRSPEQRLAEMAAHSHGRP